MPNLTVYWMVRRSISEFVSFNDNHFLVLTYLHPRVVDIECKVPVANLKRRGFVVDQNSSDNVELRNNMLPAMHENEIDK
jgi:hypothetical protein